MSTSLGNLSAVGSYDPKTANAPKLGSNTMGIVHWIQGVLVLQLRNQHSHEIILNLLGARAHGV